MSDNDFDNWYAECAIEAIDLNVSPDGYVWDLEHPDPQFVAMYQRGISPHTAAQEYFAANGAQTRH